MAGGQFITVSGAHIYHFWEGQMDNRIGVWATCLILLEPLMLAELSLSVA